MRRAVLAGIVAVASLVVFVPSGVAHGTCTAFANRPYTGTENGSPVVYFSGIESCGANRHASTLISLHLQRRPGGSTANDWTEVGSYSISYPNTNYANGASWDSGYNCAKDYRTTASGQATGHPINTDLSPIFQNTC